MKEAMLSADEKEQVNTLRAILCDSLSPYYDTDFNLLRWIQGHPGSIEHVAGKLATHLRTRAAWGLDKFVHSSREHPIHKHWPYAIRGVSGVLDNVLVMIDHSGMIDFSGMLKSYSLTECLRARTEDLEDMLANIMRLEKRTGRQASMLIVMDLSGVSYELELCRLITGPMRFLSDFITENYVELIKYFVFVNAPSFINALWMLAKPLIPEKTIEKVRILSCSNWRNELLSYVSPDLLPACWNEPCSPLFTSFSVFPTALPTEYYRCSANSVPEEVARLCIRPGKRAFVSRKVMAGERLTWWLVADGDFGLGVFFCEREDETDLLSMKIVYPSMLWLPSPITVPIEDSILASESGFYKMCLSNERAWLRTLRVEYCLRVQGRLPLHSSTDTL